MHTHLLAIRALYNREEYKKSKVIDALWLPQIHTVIIVSARGTKDIIIITVWRLIHFCGHTLPTLYKLNIIAYIHEM